MQSLTHEISDPSDSNLVLSCLEVSTNPNPLTVTLVYPDFEINLGSTDKTKGS